MTALFQTLEKNPDSVRTPKAYAFTIVRNNANKRFRDRTRRNEVEIPEHLPETPDEDDIYQEPLVRQSFQSAYANLSTLERSLLQKYYVEKWTYEQIGSELGCSAQNAWKTIKKIVSNTLTGELRKALYQVDPDLANELFPH
ncbi:MAG: RNA polymerase sigma factor [Akkermansiaceae bacterium]|nr:RNA polymerase sigma factor [Akkermansiaceae bacterium]